MNVNDVTGVEVPEESKLELIFQRQHELMLKYHDIEKKAGIGWGLLNDGYFHIDDQRSQELCKNFAWRVSEELAECMEVFYNDGPSLHCQEEAIDALHFLVELLLLNNIDLQYLAMTDSHHPTKKLEHIFDSVAKNSTFYSGNIDAQAWFVVHNLGLAMNCLKQKPWKTTHVVTDRIKFHKLLQQAFWKWVHFAHVLELDADSTYALYFKKSEVNKFRQRSGY